MRCRQSLSILFLDRWLGQTASGRLEDKGSRSLEVSTGHAHRQPAAPVPLRLRTVPPLRRSDPQSELVSLVASPFVNYFSGKFRLVSTTGYPSASNVRLVLSGQVFGGLCITVPSSNRMSDRTESMNFCNPLCFLKLFRSKTRLGYFLKRTCKKAVNGTRQRTPFITEWMKKVYVVVNNCLYY